ncbi:MAG: hypothetical protein AAF740_14465 [Bacteroidota bacterium]
MTDDHVKRAVLTAANVTFCIATIYIIEADDLEWNYSDLIGPSILLFFLMLILVSVYQGIVCRIDLGYTWLNLLVRTATLTFLLNLLPALAFSFWKLLPFALLLATGIALFSWFYEKR